MYWHRAGVVFGCYGHGITGLKYNGTSVIFRIKLLLGIVIFPVLATYFSGIAAVAYFEWFSKSNVIPGSSLQLDRYIVTIQERQVGRLSDLSGLTYSATTGTLFGVSGRPSQIVELSTDGELLRIISLDGVSDPEAIAHVAGDNFLVSDEGRKRILEVTIGERASKVTASEPSYYATTDWQFPNLGYEGLDIGNGLLYVAQEMLPSAVTVVTRATPGIIPTVREWGMNAFSRLYMLDISSLAIEKESGNVLVMSHQSALIAQYSPEGRVLGGLLLWKGRHGLRRTIPQAEGLAVGPGKEIFVVSEPNLFYRFSPLAVSGD